MDHPARFSNRHTDNGALYPPTLTPPERPLPIWKLVPAFVKNPLRPLPQQVYEDDLMVIQPRRGFYIAWVTGPRLVEQILVDDADKMLKSPVEKRVFGTSLADGVLIADGADWRWQRRALAPLFRPVDVQSYVPAMAAAANAQIARWRTAGSSHTHTIDRDMSRTTYDVILSTMLAGNHPAEAEAIRKGGSDYLARISWEMAAAILRVPKWVPHPATWHMRRAAKTLRGAVGDIVARRRAEGGSPTDLLGRLLLARHPDTNAPMSDALVISNLLTLLEAGHETTASALTWTLYLLARAPAWQQRVLDEVRAVAGDALIEAQHVPKLAVTQRVLKESMRLYPPAPVIAREPAQTLSLGGFDIPPGSQIIVPIFAIHRHRKLWTDPDLFDPDRFLPEAEAGRPRMQYMPFGGGPRICIGAQFAMTEATVLLASFVRAARFDWDGQHKPEPISRITLRPAGGMPLAVTLR